MEGSRRSIPGLRQAIAGLLLVMAWNPASRAAEPSAAAVAGFNFYIASVEARLAAQHRAPSGFVAGLADPGITARLRHGDLVVEKLTPDRGPGLPGAMLHDWRGTAFVAGATVADFERLMRDFAAYPRIYAPQVLAARVLAQHGDSYTVSMRVRQKHVIAVVLDTTYEVSFAQLDAGHAFSASRSTHIAEIEDAGTPREHALSPAGAHGFLWRLDTYWSCEERDGGLYVQIESVSLTRSIPTGLGWVIGPFVESVPRDSLAFTLGATRDALRPREQRNPEQKRRLP